MKHSKYFKPVRRKPKKSLTMVEFRQAVDDHGILSVISVDSLHHDKPGSSGMAVVFGVTKDESRVKLSDEVDRGHAISLRNRYTRQLEDMA